MATGEKDKRTENKSQRTLAKKVMISSVLHAAILGIVVMLISMSIYMYNVLKSSYSDTVYMARTVSGVLKNTADVPGLVDAVLEQERDNQDFEMQMEKSNPANTEGQLLNYHWYTEEDPPLAKRQDYQRVMDIIYSFGSNNMNLNGTCLMVFDKKTHIASLLCDVEKFGGTEAVPVKEILWRRFEDVELDYIEEERWSLLKNLYRYMRIDPRYVVFAWYEPYPYPDEDVVVFIEADVFYTHLWSNMFSFIATFLSLIIAVVFVMGIMYRKKMHTMIVKPIHAVTEAAKSYASDRRSGKQGTEYFSSLNLNTGDEFETLADTMTEMENEIVIYEKDLTRITMERERLAAELDVASDIQRNMLPRSFPLYPELNEFTVYASMDPAKEVGGDFYDIYMIDDDHLALVMADVSEKGIPAALFMVISMTLLENRAKMGGTPAEILTDVNETLLSKNREIMFVTVWLAIITLSTGHVIEANAGHTFPAIRKGDGDYELFISRHDLVLGAMNKVRYHNHEYDLEPGDRIFVYTDGLTEASNIDEQRYEEKRMLESLNRHKDDAPEDLLKSVKADVDAFVGDADQFDDLTMLSFRYFGKKSS